VKKKISSFASRNAGSSASSSSAGDSCNTGGT
jgi:hypothetical protein